ncbi:hypothetical protein DL95DRAFT_428306 [Leptodontidium sp. 2 PMI_412]|nr:hypothetical protein DL95DRAFT_428306 [Leptodontidium sp. 2 PMI_412]
MTSANANLPDVNKGPAILAVCGAMTLLALVVVCMRIFVRTKFVHKLGLDDYVMLVAMALSLSAMCIIIPEVQNGAGRHIAYLEPATASMGLKLNYASQHFFLWGIALVKVSIALFLLRISATQFYTRMLKGTIAFLIIYTFMCFLFILLQCKDLAILWDSTVKTTCWTGSTMRGLGYLYTVINICTDLLFAFLPIPMLWNVRINGRKKASLICILGLGVFAGSAAIVKLTYLPNYGKAGDFLWDSANLTIWSVLVHRTISTK